MALIPFKRAAKALSGLSVIMVFCLLPVASAQDRDSRDSDRSRDNDRGRDNERGRDNNRNTRLEAGTVISVRTNESIEAQKGDNRVYTGIVDQSVRGDSGRLLIPQGSKVELIVRVSQNNDLMLDLESVVVDGARYAIRTEPKQIDARRDDSLIGGIVGAINGGEGRGRTVRVPRDSIVTFRLQQALDMGVADRGSTRDGRHYHDYNDPQDRDRRNDTRDRDIR
jgi:hypothetical protein